MRVLLILPILALFLASCSVDSDTNTLSGGGDNAIVDGMYVENGLGFECVIPSGWETELNTSIQGVSVDFVAKNSPENNFAANVLCVTSAHSGTTDMTESLEYYVSMIKENPNFSSLEIISSNVQTIDGIEVGRVEYSCSSNGYSITCRELLFIRGNTDVQIAFTDLQTTFNDRTEFDAVENSLSFLE